MSDFITDFFINPIAERTGYNMFNTLFYASLAIIAVYLLWLLFQKSKIRIDNDFFYGVLTFVLFGSTARVVTDAVDAGTLTAVTPLHKLILDSGFYQYGFITVTPGIYVVVAAILLVCALLLSGHKLDAQKQGYQFNPVEFNAKEWVEIARAAGMNYLVFTTKHHDGWKVLIETL
jgi:uncharacterized membrane protein